MKRSSPSKKVSLGPWLRGGGAGCGVQIVLCVGLCDM